MIRKYSVIVLFAFLVSCEFYTPLGNESDYMNSLILLEFESGSQANRYVHNIIRYQRDSNGQYVSSPKEMWEHRVGDCEDYCVLLAYILRQNYGVEPVFIHVEIHGVGHCLLKWGANVYDPTNGYENYYPSKYDIPGYKGSYEYQYYMAWTTDGWRK